MFLQVLLGYQIEFDFYWIFEFILHFFRACKDLLTLFLFPFCPWADISFGTVKIKLYIIMYSNV